MVKVPEILQLPAPHVELNLSEHAWSLWKVHSLLIPNLKCFRWHHSLMACYEVGQIVGVTHTWVDVEIWRGSGRKSSSVRMCCHDIPCLPLGCAVRAMSSCMHSNVFQTIWAIFHSLSHTHTHHNIRVRSCRNTINTQILPPGLKMDWGMEGLRWWVASGVFQRHVVILFCKFCSDAKGPQLYPIVSSKFVCN